MRRWIEQRHGGQIWLLWVIGSAALIGLVAAADGTGRKASEIESLLDEATGPFAFLFWQGQPEGTDRRVMIEYLGALGMIQLFDLAEGSADSLDSAKLALRDVLQPPLRIHRLLFWASTVAALVIPLVLLSMSWIWLGARTGRTPIGRWHWGKLVVLWGLVLIGLLIAFESSYDTEGWSLAVWALVFAPVLVTTWIWLSARDSAGKVAADEPKTDGPGSTRK